MLRRHFFLAGAVLIVVLMLVAGGLKLAIGRKGPEDGQAVAQTPAGAGGGALVSAVTIVPATFTDAIDVIGVAKGRQSVTLTAAASQLIDRVHFTPGQSVAKGQVLVELKANEQEASLAQSEARLVEAQRAYDRYQTLGQKGFVSKASIDQYEAAYLAAKADVAAAKSRQADLLIRAPFAGVVGLTDITPGALINPGSAIVTLDDVSAIRVDFQIPDRFVASIRAGQAISAQADAYPGETFKGRIAQLDTRIDENTRALTARAEFPNPSHRLKPGMMIRVAVAQGVRQGLSAPESAVMVQGDNAFVFVVSQQGARAVAEQRPIVTGARQNGLVEIRDGVAQGDRVVADGLNKVQSGRPVKLVGAAGGHDAKSGPAV